MKCPLHWEQSRQPTHKKDVYKRQVLQIHDELLIEAPLEEEEEVKNLLTDRMKMCIRDRPETHGQGLKKNLQIREGKEKTVIFFMADAYSIRACKESGGKKEEKGHDIP